MISEQPAICPLNISNAKDILMAGTVAEGKTDDGARPGYTDQVDADGELRHDEYRVDEIEDFGWGGSPCPTRSRRPHAEPSRRPPGVQACALSLRM